jgi:hypothetical protein
VYNLGLVGFLFSNLTILKREKMKNFLETLGIILIFFFMNTSNGSCQNGQNELLGGGVYAEFSPDAIGTYYLNYSATGFYPWQLTVRVFWQSDTYPGWREFYVRNYLYVNSASDSVTLNSETDDNVRYRVEFWTYSSTAIGSWTFN